MNFLKWYSVILVSIAVILCIFAAETNVDIIGGLLFAPVAVYLWIQIKEESNEQKAKKRN